MSRRSVRPVALPLLDSRSRSALGVEEKFQPREENDPSDGSPRARIE
jgi:hypothetical protein